MIANVINARCVYHVPGRHIALLDARLLVVRRIGFPLPASRRRCGRDSRTLQARRRVTMFSVV